MMTAVKSIRDRSAEKEELCNAPEMSVEPPKITPLMRGRSLHMQGSIDESKNNIEKNMVPLEAEKRSGKRSMRRKCHTGAESGTCNVCSAPCSSCMHRNLACVGPKGDEFSDETGHLTAISHCSVNNGDVHTASEASNMLSLNSSHDSFSEIAESKVNIRSSDTVDASVESEMLPKLFSGDVSKDHLSSKPHHLLDHKNFSNEHEDSESVLADDDNMQCIRGNDDAGITVTCRNKNMDKKKASCSSALDSCLESEGFEKALLSDNSDPLETSLDNVNAGVSIPKVQRKYTSCSGNGTNLEGGPSFQVKQEITTEHPNLPSSKGAANYVDGDDNLSARYIADNYGKSASKASSRDNPKLEPEINRISGDEIIEDFKYPEKAGQDEKLNESAQLPDRQKPLLSLSGDESDESEILEHDVKVCDICGDAGREDLLAICSRCSDGAEHTYCMREMLQKVPEGEWLCEECKLAEEIENQKQGSDVEGKMVEKAGAQSSGKRHAENTEFAPASKRQAIETSLGSPKPSSPSKLPALSRDSSFRNLDKGIVKPARQVSFGNHLSIDIPDIARSSSTNPRLQTPKGTLLKSNSFNTLISKSKVRAVDEVLQKNKGGSENSSLDVKDPARIMKKSMSFKSANPGRSNVTGSKVKMLSPKFSHVQDVKGLKQMKDRNSFERKNLSKLDRPPVSSVTTNSGVSMPKADQKPTPRGENSVVESASNSRDSKAAQSDSKLGTLLRSTSSVARKAAEIPVTSARTSTTNIAPVEQKLSQISPKDEPSSTFSWTIGRTSNNANENLQDGLPQSRELSSQGEKTKESAVSCLRPTVTSGQKNTICQKCKEIGHAAEYCTIFSSQDSETDVHATKSVKDGSSKGSMLKPAIEAPMLKKPGIYRKRKESNDVLSSSNMDVSGEIASSDLVLVSNKMKDSVSDGQIHEREANLGTESHKVKSSSTVKQLNMLSTDVVFPCNAVSFDSISSVGMNGQGLAGGPVFQRASAIPDHEHIWQGTFDLFRAGKPLDMYGGIQAHLSTCASAKVLEVVKKFPPKLIFDEVPLLTTWPKQFRDDGVKEDNIALYFFAKDLGSYESYKGLLDHLIKKDLALKGSLDGVELLVFPSTQLPQKSQRWNMLFFLWGVFKARRSNCSDFLKKSAIPSLNAPASVLPLSDNLCSRETAVCDSSCDAAMASSAPDEPYMPLLQNPDKKLFSSQTNSDKQGSGCDSKSLSNFAARSASLCPGKGYTSFSQEEGNIQEFRLDTEAKPSASTSSSVTAAMETQIDMHGDGSHARECTSSFKVNHVSNEDLCVGATGSKEEMVDARDHHTDNFKLRRDLNESIADMDIEAPLEMEQTREGFNSWQSNSRERGYLSLSETGTQTSGSSSQKTPWSKVDGIFAEEVYSKKPKTHSSGQYGCSDSREAIALSDTFASQLSNLCSSSSVEEKHGKASVDKVITDDVGTAERYFFPVASHCSKDFWLGSHSMRGKERLSEDEDRAHDGAPNLELALGAETTSPSKGNLPFLVGMVGRNHKQSKPPDQVKRKEEDGISASLSLSLSFPFPDKEQTVKPISKTELLPDRRHVNTSLLLYERFSDK